MASLFPLKFKRSESFEGTCDPYERMIVLILEL